MSNMVTIKNGEFYYQIPEHEFSRYWLPEIDFIELNRIPERIPYVSKLAGLKRGGGKHDKDPHSKR
jgi:hypothetical protein